MWYVCDDEFGLAFSDGFATEAEAEAAIPEFEAWMHEHNMEQDFIVLFIEG